MSPKSITYHSKSKKLELIYPDDKSIELSAEYLRVYSPSAEVKGHSEDQRVLQTGKKHIGIENLETVGNYALKIVFSDGHDSGIFSWNYLQELYEKREDYWSHYLQELEQANESRLPPIPVGQWKPTQAK